MLTVTKTFRSMTRFRPMRVDVATGDPPPGLGRITRTTQNDVLRLRVGLGS